LVNFGKREEERGGEKMCLYTLQPGGSILHTHLFLKSNLPTLFSGVITQSAGGRQAITSGVNDFEGVSCSIKMT
jgi:hypothetical protein